MNAVLEATTIEDTLFGDGQVQTIEDGVSADI